MTTGALTTVWEKISGQGIHGGGKEKGST